MLDVDFVGSSNNVEQQINGPTTFSSNSQPPSVGTPSIEQSLHSSRSSSFVNIDQTGIPATDHNGGLQSIV